MWPVLVTSIPITMKKYYSLFVLFLCSAIAQADVFYVTSTADDASGGFVGPQGTLRWAIYESNENPGLDYIHFNLKDDGSNVIDANGVFVITMSINYQQMGYNGAVIIDGYTQPGATVGNPKVRIIGSNNDVFQFVQDNADGPRDASGSVVRGFYLGPVNSFSISILGADDILIEDVWVGIAPDGTPVNNTGQSKGITITGANCGAGCPANPDAICHNITIRNAVFSSNALMGIDTWRTEGLHISNTYIGTNKDGTVSTGFGNGGAGIWCGQSENSIIENCVIAGNDNSGADPNQASTGGINIYSGEDIIIRNNIVGATTNGSPAGNGNFGVIITGGDADGNGPATAVQVLNNSILNTTSGREPGHGILLANSNTIGNIIQGNSIRNNAMHGIVFSNAEANTNVVGAPVGSNDATLRNVISANGGDGINVSEGDFNTLRINSVYCNVGDKEHDLNGGTGNEGNPAPQFTSGASIKPVTGIANSGDVIDFYAMSTCKTCSPSLQGDGLRWLGSAIASGGTFSYSGPVAESVIATATNSNGSTSEFSNCVQLFDECVFPIVSVGDDIEICGTDLGANKVSLQGSFPLEVEKGTWTVESGLNAELVTFGDPHANLTTVDGLTSGDYVFRWTIINNNPAFLEPCAAFAEMTITVDAIPDAANAGEWQFLCEGAQTNAIISANIPANGTGLWSWISSPQGIIDSPTNGTTNVSGLSVGNNALRWTIDSDLGICPAEINDVLIVVEEVVSAGPDISRCGATPPVSINISANTVPEGSPTILWEQIGVGNGIAIQNPWDQHPWLNNVPAGTHQFIYNVNGGNCPDTLTVTVGGGAPVAMAGDDQITCDDNTILGAIPDPDGAVGQWIQLTGGAYSISDETDPSAELSGLNGDYVFQWTVTNACASDDDQVSISVGSTTSMPTVVSPVSYCTGDTPSSLVEAVVGGENLFWYYELNGGTANSAAPTVMTSTSGTTSYFVSQTVEGCESGRAEIIVVVNEIPQITNTDLEQTICSDDESITINFISSNLEAGFEWVSNTSDVNGVLPDGMGASLTSHVLSYNNSSGGQGSVVYSVVPSAKGCIGDEVDFTIFVDRKPVLDSYIDDQELCGTSITLNAAEVIFGNAEWTILSGPGSFDGATSSTNPSGNLEGLTPGSTTKVIWEIYNGVCPVLGDSVDVVSVLSVNPSVTLFAPSDACEGDEVLFNASANTNGIFTLFETTNGIGAPLYNSSSSENNMSFSMVIPAEDLDISVSFEGKECVAMGAINPVSDTAHVQVHLLPEGQANILEGNELTTCAAEVDLSAADITVTNGVGRWELLVGPAILSEQAGYSTTVSGVSSPGTAEIIWIVGTNPLCPEDTAKFTINQLGTVTSPSLAANARAYCGNSSLPMLTHEGGIENDESMNWSVYSESPGVTTIDGSSGQVQTAEIGQTNIYQLTIYKTADSACRVTDTIHVFFWEEPIQASVNEANILTCSDPVALGGVLPLPNPATGRWTVTSGSCTISTDQMGLPNAQITNLNSGGSCIARWTVSNGLCVDHSFADVTINKLADITKATIGVSGDANEFFSTNGLMDLCIDGRFYVEPSIPSNDEIGEWSIVSGSAEFIDENTVSNQELTLIQTGTTTLKWEISKTGELADVCPADSLLVTFDVFGVPVADISDPINGASFCSNETVNFEATSIHGAGEWTIPASSRIVEGDVSSNSISLAGMEVGIQELLWTVDNEVCSPDVAFKTIEILPVENVSITLPHGGVLCQGTSLDLTATVEGQGSGTVTWSGHPDITSQTGTEVILADLTNGEYTITATVISGLQCPRQLTASDVYNLTVVDGPAPDVLENDIKVCEGENDVALTAKFEIGNSIQWHSVHEGVLTGEDNETLMAMKTGQYFFYEDNGVCDPVASDTVQIEIIEVPKVEAPGFLAMYAGSEAYIEATISGLYDSVSWSGVTFIENPNINETILKPELGEGGLYEVTIYVANGPCGRTDEFMLAVREPLQIPNAFTPNKDGDNDLWDIRGIDTYPEAYVRIFNRWGNLLYEHYGYETWDGTFNGKDLPVATYYYVINLNAPEAPNAESLSGHVTIIR